MSPDRPDRYDRTLWLWWLVLALIAAIAIGLGAMVISHNNAVREACEQAGGVAARDAGCVQPYPPGTVP